MRCIIVPVSVLSALAVNGVAAQDTTGVSPYSPVFSRQKLPISYVCTWLSKHCTTIQQLGDAQAILDNPNGAQYKATLPDAAFDKDAYPDGSNARGSIQAVSTPDGAGVMFHVDFSNLPSEGGPFSKNLITHSSVKL